MDADFDKSPEQELLDRNYQDIEFTLALCRDTQTAVRNLTAIPEKDPPVQRENT